LDAGDEQLVRLLAQRARAGGMSLAGEGGLLAQLTKLVLEAGLEAEFDRHIGYGRTSAPAARTPATARGPRRC
jgi:putative transposase